MEVPTYATWTVGIILVWSSDLTMTTNTEYDYNKYKIIDVLKKQKKFKHKKKRTFSVIHLIAKWLSLNVVS